jgi:preprotein translocase subunit SecA
MRNRYESFILIQYTVVYEQKTDVTDGVQYNNNIKNIFRDYISMHADGLPYCPSIHCSVNVEYIKFYVQLLYSLASPTVCFCRQLLPPLSSTFSAISTF